MASYINRLPPFDCEVSSSSLSLFAIAHARLNTNSLVLYLPIFFRVAALRFVTKAAQAVNKT
jgi:hypothetical protein